MTKMKWLVVASVFAITACNRAGSASDTTAADTTKVSADSVSAAALSRVDSTALKDSAKKADSIAKKKHPKL